MCSIRANQRAEYISLWQKFKQDDVGEYRELTEQKINVRDITVMYLDFFYHH